MSTDQLEPNNIKSLYFKHPTLTHISGNPTYTDLQKLYKQAKENAQSVPWTHGGVSNGHLGLIINAITYACINPETVYTRLTLPADLGSPPPNITQAQISERLRFWNHQVGEHNLANKVKRIILNQLEEALDEHILMPKINEDTRIVTGAVTDLMTYLFDSFGDISDQNINKERQKFINHTYVHSDSIANFFNFISKYTTMVDASGTPETDE